MIAFYVSKKCVGAFFANNKMNAFNAIKKISLFKTQALKNANVLSFTF